ncbi:MAG: hypothetical protein AMQ74_01638 [Candidatus Methanofastidiosum methylothiophilum]|uniref:Uncharacterized protein n=1 Tax=Candidatus Methanofastidiosum methylothiophilum TaxID=1705564 RepID=A0A150ISQ6_9EURY|nr:MAG: hypothetical protein AMQ74_01638 [Candidatus Methanofastidiosum methylthiophilus]
MPNINSRFAIVMSASKIRILSPIPESAIPKLAAIVVLPTPPFPEDMTSDSPNKTPPLFI